jgi:uncharacterized DUF497 family protein
VQFEWDERKRKANLRKHRLDFLGAPRVFDGVTVTIADDREDYDEERYLTFGFLGTVLVAIAWTPRQKGIRLISMRKAKRNEEASYLSQVGH